MYNRASAKATKDYLIDQHMYSTKTMALTVWKPDNERPGRHWIYMSRYADFVAELQDETHDLEAIQMLARRVRKKPNEFFEHAKLWDNVCAIHLKVSLALKLTILSLASESRCANTAIEAASRTW